MMFYLLLFNYKWNEVTSELPQAFMSIKEAAIFYDANKINMQDDVKLLEITVSFHWNDGIKNKYEIKEIKIPKVIIN